MAFKTISLISFILITAYEVKKSILNWLSFW